ncbi:MAG: PadR family transcriptional regulator [Enterococcus sp.]
MENMTELYKGVLEGVVLQIIKNKKEAYGYEITNQLIEAEFQGIVEGTVYTLLVRLEKKGLLINEKRKSTLGPMRKFYRLTPEGTIYLEQFWGKWAFLQTQVNQIKEEE